MMSTVVRELMGSVSETCLVILVDRVEISPLAGLCLDGQH